MISAKLHKLPNGSKVLAMCDTNLLGKRFEENELQLDITPRFYNGSKLKEEQAIAIFKTANVVNLVGEESVRLGIKAGIVNKKKIIKISGIPHTQVVIIS